MSNEFKKLEELELELRELEEQLEYHEDIVLELENRIFKIKNEIRNIKEPKDFNKKDMTEKEEKIKDIYGKSEYKYIKEGSEFHIMALFMASLLYFFRESVSKAFGMNTAEAEVEIILRILLVVTGIFVFILVIVERIHREKIFNEKLKKAIEAELKEMNLYEEFKDELHLLK